MKTATISNHDIQQAAGLKTTQKWRGGRPALSMIEMGIALMVIVTFIALALGGAQRVLGQSEVTEEATNIAMLSSAIRATRTGAGYNTDDDGIMRDLEATNGIPTNMAYVRGSGTTAGTLSNRWSGSVTFEPTADHANFNIIYAGIPPSECTQLLLTVKGGILRSVGNGSNEYNLSDLTTSNVASLCGDDLASTITWSSALAN